MAQRIGRVGPVVTTVVLIAALGGCGDGEDKSTEPSTTVTATSTTSSATTTSVVSTSTTLLPRVVSVGEVIAQVTADVNEPGGTPRSIPECWRGWPGPAVDMAEPARRATVLYCALRTEPPADIGEGPLVVVLDDDATAAYVIGGTDMSGWILSPFRAAPGLLCREFVAGLSELPSGFDLHGREVYAFALAYWFLEGEPARMDADGDRIPCEQIFPPEVVRDVWSGDVRV